jgi:hypothetical protein
VEYIERVINKYFKGNSFICVSDDITWCKENLAFIKDIVFVDNRTYFEGINSTLIDFFIPMLCKANICSPSSFGMASAIMNPNKHLIINTPYYKNEEFNKSINL